MSLPAGEIDSIGIAEQLRSDIETRIIDLRHEGRIVGLDLLNANPDHAPSKTYVGIKRAVAEQLGVCAHLLETHTSDDLPARIERSNEMHNIYGIVVQLPLREDEQHGTEDILSMIKPTKDVDGLRGDEDPMYKPATPVSIMRLLEGHGVDLGQERVAVLGLGKLVGAPLLRILEDGGADVRGVDLATSPEERLDVVNSSSVIVSAMGAPHSLTPDVFTDMSVNRVLVDAGTAEAAGRVSGDVHPDLREQALQHGWAITAQRNSVGPLTVLSLFDNVATSAEMHS